MDQPPPSNNLPSHTLAYIELRRMFEDNKLEECIAGVRTQLSNLNLPRWHRIANLLLLAFCMEDWHVRERLRLIAEGEYLKAEQFYPLPHPPRIIKDLKSLKDSLDSLKRKQEEQLGGVDGGEGYEQELECLADLKLHDDSEELGDAFGANE